MFYFVKAPWWLKKIYPDRIWQMPDAEKVIYLTFDDGPHPAATPFVLEQLNKFNAKATFFCIGKNVLEHFDVYERLINEGHAVGNHTHNHLNGWKTNDASYIENIKEAKKYIDSNLFRPPYGRITKFQSSVLGNSDPDLKIIMWSVLSGDFDKELTPRKCLENVLKKSGSGSIIVFHDSEKAFDKLKYVLPETLLYFSEKGYKFKKIVL